MWRFSSFFLVNDAVLAVKRRVGVKLASQYRPDFGLFFLRIIQVEVSASPSRLASVGVVVLMRVARPRPPEKRSGVGRGFAGPGGDIGIGSRGNLGRGAIVRVVAVRVRPRVMTEKWFRRARTIEPRGLDLIINGQA